MPGIRVAIVEDQPLYRELLTAALRSHASTEVVVSAGSVGETRLQLEAATAASDGLPIDCLLVDIELPDGNGVGLAVQLRRQYPELGVIVLSSKDVFDVVEALPEHRRRPWSYLHKSSGVDLERVVHVIWASLRGVPIIDGVVRRTVPETPIDSPITRLTSRQLEVLALVAESLTNEAIAERLGISLNSVVNHLGAVYRRLELIDGANPRVAAALAYLEHVGLLHRSDASFGHD